MKIVLILLLTVPIVSIASSIQSSFSAKLVSLISGERVEFRVHVSPYGVRLQGDSAVFGEPGISISSVSQKKNWLIKPQSKMYTLMSAEAMLIDGDFIGGVLSNSPCIGSGLSDKRPVDYTAELGGVTVWECVYSGYVVEESFSERLGLVVREKIQGGSVETYLEGIVERHHSEDFFLPPNHYKQVSLRELLTGALELTPYGK